MIPPAVVECYSCIPACVSLSLFATLRCPSPKHDTAQRSGALVRKFHWRFQSLSKKPLATCEQDPHVNADSDAAKGSRPEAAEIGTEIGIAIGAVVGAVIGTAVGTVVGAVVRRVPVLLAHVRAEGSLGKTVEGRVTPEDELYDGIVAPDGEDRKAIQAATEVCGVARLASLTQTTAPALAHCEIRGSVAAAAHLDVPRSQIYADVEPVFHSTGHLLRDTSSESLGDWELVMDPSTTISTANASKRSENWSGSNNIHDKQSSELLKHCGVAPASTARDAQQSIACVPTTKLSAIPTLSLTSASSIRDPSTNETNPVANYVSPWAKHADNFSALQKYIQCISSENGSVLS